MKLSPQQALFWCEQLLAVAVLLQSIEILFLRSKIRAIWKTDVLPAQLLRISGCIGLFLSPDPLFHLSIVMGTLLSARQFGGTFNGGSDIMTFHVLLAVTLARLFPQAEPVTLFALGYLSLQLIASYFISGIVKLRKASWRQGLALKRIVASPFYPVQREGFFRKFSQWKILSWLTIGFEILFPLSLLNSTMAMIFIPMAILFHLGNFWILGLNRFVFAWLAAYPALIWLSGIR